MRERHRDTMIYLGSVFSSSPTPSLVFNGEQSKFDLPIHGFGSIFCCNKIKISNKDSYAQSKMSLSSFFIKSCMQLS